MSVWPICSLFLFKGLWLVHSCFLTILAMTVDALQKFTPQNLRNSAASLDTQIFLLCGIFNLHIWSESGCMSGEWWLQTCGCFQQTGNEVKTSVCLFLLLSFSSHFCLESILPGWENRACGAHTIQRWDVLFLVLVLGGLFPATVGESTCMYRYLSQAWTAKPVQQFPPPGGVSLHQSELLFFSFFSLLF